MNTDTDVTRPDGRTMFWRWVSAAAFIVMLICIALLAWYWFYLRPILDIPLID